MEKGPAALKEHELLAILLGFGCKGRHVLDISRHLLAQYPAERLATLSFDQLRKLKGIGPAKACTVVAAFELARRSLAINLDALPVVHSPKQVLDIADDIRRRKKEHFLVLYLNARNQLIHKETVSIGSLNANIVHPREVFQPAIGNCAASIILVHNHPSGDTTPSSDDIQVTERMVTAGEIMGIEVLDHVIVSERGFCSLKEERLTLFAKPQ